MDQEEGFLPGSCAPSRSDTRDSGPVVELAANKAAHTHKVNTQGSSARADRSTEGEPTFYSSVGLCGVELCGVGGEPANGRVAAGRVVEAVDFRVVLRRAA